MKNLREYLKESLNESILVEAKLDTVDVDVDTLLSNCHTNVKKEDLAETITTIMNMGYKPVNDTPFTDNYGTYSFYLFSKGKTSDAVLVSCCARGRHDHDALVIAYTANKAAVNKSDDEIIVRAADGYKKSANVDLNNQEMVNVYLQEGDFGEYNTILKKTTWYTKAKYWMKSSFNNKSSIWSVRSFYK